MVHTLRREKDNLTTALQNQREANLAMTKQVTALSIRAQQLEEENLQLRGVQMEDQKTVEILEHRFQNAVAECD